jgi:hypothetical protein
MPIGGAAGSAGLCRSGRASWAGPPRAECRIAGVAEDGCLRGDYGVRYALGGSLDDWVRTVFSPEDPSCRASGISTIASALPNPGPAPTAEGIG